MNVHLLLDEQATRLEIQKAAEVVMVQSRPQDTFVFFYSGHGETRSFGKEQEEQFYLLPANFNPSGGNSELYDHGISGLLLQSWFLKIPARHQLAVINSSKSGDGMEEFIKRVDEDLKFLSRIARRDFGLLFIKRKSYEFKQLKNGLLPYVLIEGLKGSAADDDGALTVKNLIEYVEENSPSVLRRSGGSPAQRVLSGLSKTGMPDSYFSGKDFLLGTRPAAASGVRVGAAVEAQGARPLPAEASKPRDARDAYALGVAAASAPGRADDDVPIHLPKPECSAISEFTPAKPGPRAGKDHALLFGVDTYDNSNTWTKLNNPVLDVTKIAEVLHTRYGFATEVVKNTDSACFDDFILKYATRKYADDEQLLIFFAGHGKYKSNGDGFLIVKDSKPFELMGRSWVPHALLGTVVDAIPCKHIFLVLDACFGGAMVRINRPVGSDPAETPSGGPVVELPAPDSEEEFIRVQMQFRTRRLLTSGGNEYVQDGPPGSHSPFARKLLAGLNLNATGRSFVTLSEIVPRVKQTAPFEPPLLFDAWLSNQPQSEFFFFPMPAP